MNNNKSIIFIIVFTVVLNGVYTFGKISRFPSGFKFGIATASYQIEGAWNVSGKGENIWDYYTHNYPKKILDHTTGDVACDSYNLWREDVKLLKNIGVHYYRFSISWSRILPTGFSYDINPDGVRYYDNLINDLIANGIEPMVTIYHWDLPQPLQELGGMVNPKMVDYFGEYSYVLFKLFGDRVKKWITFNEPPSVCVATYERGECAPGIQMEGIAAYLCSKTLLLAHARAYHIYEDYFRSSQGGKVGITIDSRWYDPKTNSSSDISAAERSMEMEFGWWANPIFSSQGDYPEMMKNRIAYFSKVQNFNESRLPELSQEEINYIRGTYDFFGLNHYTSRIVSEKNEPPSEQPSIENDIGVNYEVNPNWKRGAADWLYVVPSGFRKLINWIRKKYDNPLVYITENGYADQEGLNDLSRINYHHEYLEQLLLAIEDGCNVQRYTIWSLMDNMEWGDGYTMKFGIYKVDFSSRDRNRTAKKSASYYKNVINNHGIPKFINETFLTKNNN